MDTIQREAIKSVWEVINESDKKCIMNQFIRTHGEYYTKDDLLSYLKQHYIPSRSIRLPADTVAGN